MTLCTYPTIGLPTGMMFPPPSSSASIPTGYQYTKASMELSHCSATLIYRITLITVDACTVCVQNSSVSTNHIQFDNANVCVMLVSALAACFFFLFQLALLTEILLMG